MSNISPSAGGNSPPPSQRVSLSVDEIKLKGKRKIDDISSEGEIGIGEPSKQQKISSSLKENIENIVKIIPSLKQKNLDNEEKHRYDNNIKELLEYNNEYINGILALLPKLSTKPIENILRYQNLYRNISHPSTREIIKAFGGKSIAKNLETMEKSGDSKKDTEKQTLSPYDILNILTTLYKNKNLIVSSDDKNTNILDQFFPKDDAIFAKEKEEGKHIIYDYEKIQDFPEVLENEDLLFFLIENANPDIRKAISSKDKFFEDDTINDNFIKNFIEKHGDNPKILGRILENDTLLSSTQFDFLKGKVLQEEREIFSDFNKGDLWLKDIITAAYNNIKQNPQNISSKNLELLIEFSKSPISAYKGNSDFIEKFMSIGIELERNYGNFELLISLLHREDLETKKYLNPLQEILHPSNLLKYGAYSNDLLDQVISSTNKDVIKILSETQRLSNDDKRHDDLVKKLLDYIDTRITDGRLSQGDIKIFDIIVGRNILLINNENNDIFLGQLITHAQTISTDDESSDNTDDEDFKSQSLKILVQRPRLSSNDDEHNERLGKLINHGIRHEDTELLIALAKRDRLSVNDDEHKERLGKLIDDGIGHKDTELLITLAKRERLSVDDMEHNQRIGDLIKNGKECEDTNLLITLASRTRLSTNDTEHNERLGALIDIGKDLFVYHEDFTPPPISGLLTALAQRDRLSVDDNQNAERFMYLYEKYNELKEIISRKENFQEMRDKIFPENYQGVGGA